MNIAKLIDHTVLKPNTTKEDVMKVLEEAKKYNFASVCINPTWVKLAAEELAGHDVDVCTVIGFPLGANTTETKVFETKDVIAKGATEVDMVINVGALKDGDNEFVENDIREVVEAAKEKALVKVIIETCLLTDEEKVRACELSVKAGADFVKTSTGFSTGGATAEDIALMRKTVGENVGVKASGGVRTREDAEKMIEAGASRIGASASVAIVLDDKNGVSDNY
ncbi:deoxyribose-phosphate aldolase [Bacillus pseudomycoides]|uniref:deoxyribose-phosphate aldolase n=1 Tax=Bacillus pseudomycoides TaxID=64104 RepID=UPI000BECAA53|nr:deoxyribose-phosphate aldolase [Bacillus pseudomycoides]PEE38737.1 deoxyribose-phosphate aldolase [Bacillus pseudomycoides]PGA85833.1 deoxyribose-phosphate aldolase [Bacillus pseudomycoides]PHF50031.1 deoxyribose-phosphate aldolase [Bacillus pseudomycoides]